MSENILVTGCAGFIGMSVSRALLDRGARVTGIDNLNDYYSVQLKKDRLARIEGDGFVFHHADVSDRGKIDDIFSGSKITRVCHLAAQAGVRYSLTHPFEYIKSNINGFLTILEAVRDADIANLVYASSSSVYGGNKEIPFSEEHRVDRPISLYAATKRADELMAHSYSHLFGIKTTGLRLFTVYGPWGRPDMALFKFSRLIMEGKPIEVYNHGEMFRDFTYIGDAVAGIIAALDTPFDYEVFNIGTSATYKLGYLIELIEKNLGRTAEKLMMPYQPGDVRASNADVSHAEQLLGYKPATSLETGVENFCRWFLDYYKYNKHN